MPHLHLRRKTIGLVKLMATYHNLFDGTVSWHPRVRFAETVHVFNNHFKAGVTG
jgi:pectate lyase